MVGRRAGALLAAVAGGVVAAEVGFRALYRSRKGVPYERVPKVPFDRLYIEPHPYLSYVYKKRHRSQPSQPAGYPLNPERNYRHPETVSNNFGLHDGPGGDRDIAVPKPEGLTRVLCLGGSTTANYIEYEGEVFSYPLLMEAILRERFPDRRLDVHNAGYGGWNSAEILVNFLLNLYDTEPDVVVICHAYNDLAASLTPGFLPDYSHSRRSLGEVFHLFRWASRVPDLPLASYNWLASRLFPYRNPRNEVLRAVTRAQPDLDGEFRGLDTYVRNMRHIVRACIAEGIQVLISSYAHYLYEEIEDSAVHLKYREGLLEENEAVRKMAEAEGVAWIDNFALIPRERRYFVDSVHYSHEGMELVARNIGEGVAKLIEEPSADGSRKRAPRRQKQTS